MRAFCAIVVVLLAAVPARARADSVMRVGLDTDIEELVAGADGGAWVSTYAYERQALHRIAPDGAVRTVADDFWASNATLGPDGNAWFQAVGSAVARVDAAGTVTPFAVQRLGGAMGAGPDGTVWVATLDRGLARVAPDGTVTPVPLELPGCSREGWPTAIARAADGAMWLHVVACGFVRWPAGGKPTVLANPRGITAEQLEPDAAGGMWFATDTQPGGGHVDAGGRVSLLRGVRRGTSDVDVAPDGSAWFATRECGLVHATQDGTTTRAPVPVPTWQLELTPEGGLWLASPARVERTTLGAPAERCDDTPPAVTIRPRLTAAVSLAALRRHHGFKLTVREPFGVEAFVADAGEDPFTGVDGFYERGRTLHVPISPRKLRQLGRRKHPVLHVIVRLRDQDGNYADIDREVRVRR